MSVAVIIPTIGSLLLNRAVQSVLNQTTSRQVHCYVVVDGQENVHCISTLNNCSRVHVCILPRNVGKNNFYGHRVYAAFTHLIDTDYVVYLDEDNWMEPDHIEKCLCVCEEQTLDWVFSLRNIYIQGFDAMLCRDECESLGNRPSVHGYNLVDTNCYFLRTAAAIQVASAWHGQWGQDRVFFKVLSDAFPKFACTDLYTVNYTAKDSLRPFFVLGNSFLQSNTHAKSKDISK